MPHFTQAALAVLLAIVFGVRSPGYSKLSKPLNGLANTENLWTKCMVHVLEQSFNQVCFQFKATLTVYSNNLQHINSRRFPARRPAELIPT